MRNTSFTLPSTRREFLQSGAKGIGLLAFSRFAPAFLTHTALAGAPPPEKDRSILVLVQLAGGNDGLNTVIPFEDDAYHRLRPNIRIPQQEVLPIGDGLGFHPSLAPLRGLMDEGHLAIVQNVGYPNPNRSHFRSTEIWETASEADDYLATGWLGRFFDNTCPGADAHEDPAGIHLGSEMPQSFLSATPHPVFGLSRGGARPPNEAQSRLMERLLEAKTPPEQEPNLAFLQHTMMDALVSERRIQKILTDAKPEARYPQGQLAASLRSVAAMIAAGLPTRVYFVSHGGFDTHGNQLATHARLLGQLAESMQAFQNDLDSRGLASQVLTMTFSEFGRRPSENVSKGTDHGTAAPLFVMGNQLHAGLHGSAPSLDVGPKEDLKFSTDFRSVYATVLDDWLSSPSKEVLGGDFPKVGFI
ncbi:MAG: DUF1501 domain-containing protein [Opitutaceae bacterium]